jgi:hypothetical protein
MSEGDKDSGQAATPHTPTPPTDPSPPKVEIEAPAGIVRGGTTSSEWDKQYQQKLADAEERRKQAAADAALSKIPIEAGGAKSYTHHFSHPVHSPKVLIEYHGSKKEPIMEMLCELVLDDVTGDSILQFVCPKCVSRGVHSAEAQCTARAKNRAWHLDMRGAGMYRKAQTVDLLGNPTVEMYIHAGSIMDTDALVCPHYNCGSKFKIHKNIMYDFWG